MNIPFNGRFKPVENKYKADILGQPVFLVNKLKKRLF